MDKLEIVGGEALLGEVWISGSKNAALPILVASLLCENLTTINNVPHLQDVTTTIELLGTLGVDLSINENMGVEINSSTVKSVTAPYDLVKTMRSSILVLGPLLAKFGNAKVSLPGGCAIGSRPVEMHLDALEKMGAKINIQNGYISAKSQKLVGSNIIFPKTTVTGTENILMASTLADGKTVISNAAREPEVVDLANFLNQMGASIRGHGTDTIEITGVRELKGISYSALPDRIETGTFLVAAAITGGKIVVKNTISSHVDIIIQKLKQAGAEISTTSTTITLDSGTTYNGSAAVTISVKDGGIDSDALAADISLTSLTASMVSASHQIYSEGSIFVKNHITASGNISASGTIFANTLTLDELQSKAEESTAVVIDTNGVLGFRELASNAFTSTTIGTTTNALTVDDTTLQLDSGTTFDGSGAKTISIKDGGVDSDALAASIAVTSLTATDITVSSLNVTSLTSSIVTSSILQTEGSNIFGDTISDTHNLMVM